MKTLYALVFSALVISVSIATPNSGINSDDHIDQHANNRDKHSISRTRRGIARNIELRVDVTPVNINLHPGKSSTIRCRASGGNSVDDQPYVTFYRQIGDLTHMPMSSGDPGVQVEPSIPSEDDLEDFFGYEEDHRLVRSVKILTLSPEAYYTLEKGDNLFYCKTSTLNGNTASSDFVVKKFVPKSARRRQTFQSRRTIPRPRG